MMEDYLPEANTADCYDGQTKSTVSPVTINRCHYPAQAIVWLYWKAELMKSKRVIAYAMNFHIHNFKPVSGYCDPDPIDPLRHTCKIDETSARHTGDTEVMRMASRLVMVMTRRAMRKGQSDQSVNRPSTPTMVRNQEVLALRV